MWGFPFAVYKVNIWKPSCKSDFNPVTKLAKSFAQDWISFKKYILGILSIYKLCLLYKISVEFNDLFYVEGQLNDNFWLPDFKIRYPI